MFAKDVLNNLINKMYSWLNHIRIIYVLSNIIVLPAIFIPGIDFLANISFLITFFSLVNTNIFLSLVVCFILIIKNNSNYRFSLLLKLKGKELSKSDDECVYLYAWCTILRYFLIGMALNQIVQFFK
tara:strand:- start:893 stop:1273 length:381 start_codon:yes stop_codon:yes gene_type:complete